MNQILFNKKINKELLHKFVFLFCIFILIILLLSIKYIYTYSYNIKSSYSSSFVINSFNISNLYSTNRLSSEIIQNELSNIIGIIEIKKINIKYPIFANITDELLKISPCKFYGPNTNEIGNLCIAGHNYNNGMFFSNLFNLTYNDEIIIYDTKNAPIKYYIYNIYEVNSNDFSCTTQNTNGTREITLVTCNNITGNRLIIKAKEADI